MQKEVETAMSDSVLVGNRCGRKSMYEDMESSKGIIEKGRSVVETSKGHPGHVGSVVH